MTDGIIQQAFKKCYDTNLDITDGENDYLVIPYAEVKLLQQELIEKIKQNCGKGEGTSYQSISIRLLIGDNKE